MIGKAIRNKFEIKRFFEKINKLNTIKDQQDYSFFNYKTNGGLEKK